LSRRLEIFKLNRGGASIGNTIRSRIMTPSEFKRTLSSKKPPAGLSPALTALWWAGKDAWEKAHDIVMNGEGADCAWVHAYLHRVEGDRDNARYWYRQARREPATGELASEWAAIVAALLKVKRR
jgi:hypothetical protein